MNNMIPIIFVFYFIVNTTLALFENDSHINYLDPITIRKEIINNEILLINFYADKCEQCVNFGRIFSVAAKVIQSLRPDIFVASLNCKQNAKVFRDYEIPGLPSVKLFIEKKSFEYTGNRMVLPFVHWVISNFGDEDLVFIDESNILKEVTETDIYMAIGFFRNVSGPECEMFKETAKSHDGLSWAIVINENIFQELVIKTDNHIIIFRQFDEPRVDFKGNFTRDNINLFIVTYSMPYLTQFYDKVSKIPEVFNANFPNYLIGLIDSTHKKFTLHKMLFQKSAKLFLGKVKFIYANVDDHATHYLLSIFRLQKEDAPTYRFMKLFPDYKTIIYNPTNSKMASKRVTDFVQRVLDGTLSPYYRSEKLHQRWSKYPVKVLVGDNYDEITKDENRSVFVQLCSNKCNQCVKMRHMWYDLAMLYKDQTNLWIATIDMDKNDIRNVRVEKFPTFYFYPEGSQNVHIYEGNRTLEEFKRFIDSKGTNVTKTRYVRENDRITRKLTPSITNEIIPNMMAAEDLELIAKMSR